MAASPRWRYRRAALRELAAFLPLLVLVLVANVAFGRWAGLLVLAGVFVASTALLARTGSTRALRKEGIAFARLGTGGRPEPWRLVLFRLTPAVLLVPLAIASATGSGLLFGVAVVAYLVLWVVGLRRAGRWGRGLDPMMALTGLDVVDVGPPLTPSGTSERPAAASPPPTPAAPARPGPARRRGRPGRR